jgi:hypothetical protein
MTKLETNLDACQMSSEILLRLRRIMRETLRAIHGKEWEAIGIPDDIRDYLTQRQAREASINWNLSDAADILDFAGFLNIYDIMAANPQLLQRLLPLAPDASVLRIRFLELDTILNRIAYARPISEAELGFLVTFEDRLKKTTSGPPPAVEQAPAAVPGKPAKAPSTPSVPKAAPTPPPPAPAPRSAPASQAKPAPAEPKAPPLPPPPPEPAAPPAPAAAPAPAAPIGPQELDNALKRNDSKVILTALYQEVTALADGLWNGSVASLQARTWEKVRESQWYNDKFGKLGLKPISDFFGLFDTAKEKMGAGTSRNDLQEFLKDHSFVQVLLALKDLFRQHMKP